MSYVSGCGSIELDYSGGEITYLTVGSGLKGKLEVIKSGMEVSDKGDHVDEIMDYKSRCVVTAANGREVFDNLREPKPLENFQRCPGMLSLQGSENRVSPGIHWERDILTRV